MPSKPNSIASHRVSYRHLPVLGAEGAVVLATPSDEWKHTMVKQYLHTTFPPLCMFENRKDQSPASEQQQQEEAEGIRTIHPETAAAMLDKALSSTSSNRKRPSNHNHVTDKIKLREQCGDDEEEGIPADYHSHFCPPPTKKRRFQRRNSKTASMLQQAAMAATMATRSSSAGGMGSPFEAVRDSDEYIYASIRHVDPMRITTKKDDRYTDQWKTTTRNITLNKPYGVACNSNSDDDFYNLYRSGVEIAETILSKMRHHHLRQKRCNQNEV